MNEQRKLGFASITLLFFGFIISDAYAYIDPGSGSYSKNEFIDKTNRSRHCFLNKHYDCEGKNKLKHTGKLCDCQCHIITEKVKN